MLGKGRAGADTSRIPSRSQNLSTLCKHVLIWKPERTVSSGSLGAEARLAPRRQSARSHASRPQDAALGTGLWLSCLGAALLLGLQKESSQAPKERYFFPVLSFFHERTFFSAVLCSCVRIGYASENEPWETMK